MFEYTQGVDLITFSKFTLKDLERYKNMELTTAQFLARLQENALNLGLVKERT